MTKGKSKAKKGSTDTLVKDNDNVRKDIIGEGDLPSGVPRCDKDSHDTGKMASERAEASPPDLTALLEAARKEAPKVVKPVKERPKKKEPVKKAPPKKPVYVVKKDAPAHHKDYKEMEAALALGAMSGPAPDSMVREYIHFSKCKCIVY